MKKILCAIAMATALAPTASMANELIVGVKAGIHNVDVSGFDPAPLVSAQLSYEFLDLAAADIAVELEVGKSASDGESDAGDFSVTTAGVFISARTVGPIYAIGRIGVAKTELEFDGFDVDDSGVAMGVGIGFSTGLRTELELTRYDIDDEQALYLSLGVAF